MAKSYEVTIKTVRTYTFTVNAENASEIHNHEEVIVNNIHQFDPDSEEIESFEVDQVVENDSYQDISVFIDDLEE
jgi:hypothetical protein